MAAKFVILSLMVAAAQASNSAYTYSYGVSDPHTGDVKSQQESRVGDKVVGQYSLLDSDGTKRTVDYAADAHSGFNAVVRKDPIYAKGIIAAAPIAAGYGIAAPIAAAPIASGYGLGLANGLGYGGIAAAPLGLANGLGYGGIANGLGYGGIAKGLGYSGIAAAPLGLANGLGYGGIANGLGYGGIAKGLGYSGVAGYGGAYGAGVYGAGAYGAGVYGAGVYGAGVY